MTENNAALSEAIRNAIRKAYDDGYNDAKMDPEGTSTYCGQAATKHGTAALLSKLRAEGVQAGDERAALAWYAEQVAGCRKIGADGDAARQALDKDGGRRARAALESAPVADESPMAKMADALREKGRQEQQAYQDSRVQSTEWGPMPHGTEADLPASAPVAGEADNTDYIGLALELESAAKRVESQTVQRAIEAGAHGLRLAYSFRNAAPQASEAVRNAVLSTNKQEK